VVVVVNATTAAPIGRGPGRRMGFQKEEGERKKEEARAGRGQFFKPFFFLEGFVSSVLFWREDEIPSDSDGTRCFFVPCPRGLRGGPFPGLSRSFHKNGSEKTSSHSLTLGCSLLSCQPCVLADLCPRNARTVPKA
jgi:hypothetical protein